MALYYYLFSRLIKKCAATPSQKCFFSVGRKVNLGETLSITRREINFCFLPNWKEFVAIKRFCIIFVFLVHAKLERIYYYQTFCIVFVFLVLAKLERICRCQTFCVVFESTIFPVALPQQKKITIHKNLQEI